MSYCKSATFITVHSAMYSALQLHITTRPNPACSAATKLRALFYGGDIHKTERNPKVYVGSPKKHNVYKKQLHLKRSKWLIGVEHEKISHAKLSLYEVLSRWVNSQAPIVLTENPRH